MQEFRTTFQTRGTTHVKSTNESRCKIEGFGGGSVAIQARVDGAKRVMEVWVDNAMVARTVDGVAADIDATVRGPVFEKRTPRPGLGRPNKVKK